MSQGLSRSRKPGLRSAPSSPSITPSSAIPFRASDPRAEEDVFVAADRAAASRLLCVCGAVRRIRCGRDPDQGVLDGDEFVLNGHKRFVTSGRQARVAIVYALTDPSKGRDGLSAFIVETDTPGFSIGEGNDMLGLRATETVDLLLRDCRVPKANLLGERTRAS